MILANTGEDCQPIKVFVTKLYSKGSIGNNFEKAESKNTTPKQKLRNKVRLFFIQTVWLIK